MCHGHQGQVPFTQCLGGAQTLPHAPQFWLLVDVLTQLPEQSVSPVAHLHMPDEHVVPAVHAIPHVPQLRLLVWRSTQVPLHEVWFVPHLQTPATQDCWAGQTVVQVPQCVLLVCKSTHVPPQVVCPAGQPVHLLPLQV